jgi:carboxyl-terminal processing protease
MSHRNLLLLLGAMMASYLCYSRAEQNPYARYVAAGFSTIDRWGLENAPDQELFNAAMNGMVDVLDKYGDDHSEFIDAARQAAYQEDFQQEFGGVGLRLWLLGKPPMPTVIGLPEPGTPAASAGIRLGDRLTAVDGTSTEGMTLEDVTLKVRGPIGTPVTLTLLRAGEDATRDVEIERDLITVESVLGDLRGTDGRWNFLLKDSPRIGYARINKFGDKTAAELATVLEQLKVGGKLDGMILDVRDDPGGALDAAVEICDWFLHMGQTIVTTRGRDEVVRDRYLSTGIGDDKLPLAVIIDRNSASASEILAACLQDHGRAGIVGERSYGKGTVQRLIPIESGRSLLKLTSATYWRPSNKNIHRMRNAAEDAEWGVKPDPGLAVSLTDEQYETWQRYRTQRDLVGEDVESELARELELDDGKVPANYVDEPLARAVQHLQDLQAETAR